MERKPSSPWSVGLTLAGLLLVVTGSYGGLYWWRLPKAYVWPGDENYFVKFPSRFETAVFQPAIWVHARISYDSLIRRSGPLPVF